MIRRILFLAIVVLFAQLGFGQAQRVVSKMVEGKRLAGEKFVSFASLKEDDKPSDLKDQVALNISKFSILDIDNKSITEVLAAKPEALTMSVPSSVTGNMEIELVKVNLYTSDFAYTTDKDQRFKPSDKEVHYRGIIKGNENSVVAISIFDKQIMGLIATAEGNFVLGELEGDNATHKHVLYNDRDLKFKTPFSCSTPDDPNVRYTKDQLFKAPPASASFGPGAASCVRIYVETDYNVFVNRGSVANVNTFIAGLFNQSAMLYQNEGIFLVLSQVLVLTSASSYNPSNSATYLTSFQTLRNTFNGDLGHLVGFYSSMGGRAAGFAGLCNTNRDLDQCVSGLTVPPYPTVPTYSFNVEVFTHEMGHLMGSRHTHACVWNGTSTAIDGCAGAVEGSCPLPGIPPGGGTIMSYCHITSVGINFLLGFGPQPSNVIRNRVYTRTCLNACANNLPAVDLYIKDKSTDTGVEPNPDPTGEFWVSQDIWVRRLNDGGTVHENPRGGFTNYIYVRVRNRGSQPSFSMSNVRLRTYWAKASGALGWTSPFGGGVFGCTPPASMGSPVGNVQIPAIAAGGSVVLVFPWSAPTPANYSCFGSDRFHFCLLARIETSSYSPFGMSYPEGSNLWLNVKNNNNIGWKNVSVSNPNGTFTRPGGVVVANAEEEEENGKAMFTLAGEKQTGIKADDATLRFTFEKAREVAAMVTLEPEQPTEPEPQTPTNPSPTPTTPTNTNTTGTPDEVTVYKDVDPTPYKAINVADNIWDFAFIDVDLGIFFKQWGGKGDNIKILDEAAPSGNPWVRLLKAEAALTGINIAPGDVGTVTVRITQFKVAKEGDNQYDFDVTLNGNDGERIGGETFFANLGTREAVNKSALASKSAEEKKTSINENAIRVTTIQGKVNVYMNQGGTYEASLYDLSGKLLQTKIFSGNTVVGNDRWPKGIYVLSLVNMKTKEVTKKRVLIE